MTTADLTSHTAPNVAPDFDKATHLGVVRKAMQKRKFLNLATTSAKQIPHVAGVLYMMDGDNLVVTMDLDSVKARNIKANNRVAVSIPVPSIPFFPPFAVQFQGTAELVTPDDPGIQRLHASGQLKKIMAGHGIDHPGLAFVRITPGRRVTTYGLGLSLWSVARNPTAAMRSMEW